MNGRRCVILSGKEMDEPNLTLFIVNHNPNVKILSEFYIHSQTKLCESQCRMKSRCGKGGFIMVIGLIHEIPLVSNICQKFHDLH